MSRTALLTLNTKTDRWEATFAGKVIVSSQDKKYVRHVIEKGLNAKAREMGVTAVEELGQGSHQGQPAVDMITFDVNERFQFLEDYVDMVADRDMKSVIVVGEGGLGKSYTVMRRLSKKGLSELSVHAEGYEVGATLDQSKSRTTYVVVKGYSTPKGLFRTLYENRNRLIVFDDCDSVLDNDTSANLLKAALDSYDKRIVTWNAESFGESELPKSFEFTGAIIFISNMAMHKVPQAVISRSAPADVSMTRAEVIERMRQIVRSPEFMDEVDLSLKLEAVDFIGRHIQNPQIKTFNLRTLIKVITNRRCKPERWERLSLSMMMAER